MSIRSTFMPLALIATLAVIPSARACIGPGLETLIFVDRPPLEVPEGIAVFEVDVPADLREWKMVEVEVHARGAASHVSKLLISPGIETSCSQWGVRGKTAFVMGVITTDERGKMFLAAVQQPWEARRKVSR